MRQLERTGRYLLLFIFILVLVSGCSLQASPEEVAQAKKDFITMIDDLNNEAPNGIKVLQEIRDMYTKGEIKRTKVQNTILNGMDINDRIKDDIVSAGIPQEMEPIRERLMTALAKRKDGYQMLFDAYDFNDPSREPAADAKIQEAIQDFVQIQKDVAPYRQ
ncbi:hypothetical protein [Brevibacillus sp. SYSU BS000544]|uniref:hypothetical protein n=1 Tax=Brevibacillus sp. SYSU BS000544 TaxID=3416443 RepID=UPI003CE4DCB2